MKSSHERIYSFIRGYIQRYGIAPSTREIGRAVGLNSSATVHSHLERMVREGWIKRSPGGARSIRLLRDAGEKMIPESEIRAVIQELRDATARCICFNMQDRADAFRISANKLRVLIGEDVKE